MRFKNRSMAAMATLILTVAAGVFGIAGPAQAAQKCQPWTPLDYIYYNSSGGLSVWSKTCSGTYSLNSSGYELDAGPWSGDVTFASGFELRFCDYQRHDLAAVSRLYNAGKVRAIYMAAERAPWC